MKSFLIGFFIGIIGFFSIFFYSLSYYKTNTYSIFLPDSGYNTYLFEDGQEILPSKYKYSSLENFPNELIYLLLRSEDREFFGHFGIDIKALFRALYINFKSGNFSQGGSTITQQLAKILYLTNEKTINRKILDVFLSFHLERAYDKEQILEAYMNSVYQGNDISGFTASSHRYFRKDVKTLSVEEMVVLVGIIKGPELYNPNKYPERARNQGMVMLNNIDDFNFFRVTREEMLKKINNLTFSGAEYNERYLDLVYKIRSEEVEIGLKGGGYTIVTTYNKDLFDSFNPDENNSAIVFNNKTGEILSFWGGEYSNFFSREQIGSNVKPFYYALAIENGYEFNTILPDERMTFGDWAPNNFDKKFRGEITLRDSLIYSINIPSIYLAMRIDKSPTDSINTIEKFLKEELKIYGTYPGDLTLALGTLETSPLELGRAISIFPNYGILTDQYVISKIYDRKGNLIYERYPNIINKIDSVSIETYSKMNELLKDVIIYGSGRNANLDDIDLHGKTGTSEKASWFTGYTGSRTIVVRVDGKDLLSSTSAVPLAKEILENFSLTGDISKVHIYKNSSLETQEVDFFRDPINFILQGNNIINFLDEIKNKHSFVYLDEELKKIINEINFFYPDIAR
jgi:membrane peptidoglycan carboxypeptidase